MDGDAFRRFVSAGTRCLEQHVDAINALNVFPVPDGDTGINMLLTLRAAVSAPELPPEGTGTVAQVSRAMARGALLGARGNSGVIFSQFLKGLATSLNDCTQCDGAVMARGLASGADASYQAVGQPVEGTMLTVMRGAADAASKAKGSLPQVWEVAFRAAQEALAHTPEQLPVLKEAGVVDAGGQGVVAFMAGAQAFLHGREEASLELAVAPAGWAHPSVAGASGTAVTQEFLEHTEAEEYGYCVQYVVRGDALDVDELRAQVVAVGWSTAVVGDDSLIKVHAHASDPGPLLSLGTAVGSLEQVKVENMDTMHQAFMALHGYVAASREVGVVVVAPGNGLEVVFRDLGAAVVVRGGQTMNPSAQELVEASQRSSSAHVVLLPNNPNVVLAAQQAAELAETPCTVVPSRSIPQGIAALLAFKPDMDAGANAQAMTRALDTVRSGEVTTAVRASKVGGAPVKAGQSIAFLEGELVAAAATPERALEQLLETAGLEPGALVTLYWGGDTQDAAAAADSVRRRWPEVEVEVVHGGQPHYHYLVSIE